MTTVYTKDKDWLETFLKACKDGLPTRVIDNGGLGLRRLRKIAKANGVVTPLDVIKQAHDGGMSWGDICLALSGIGVAGLGIWMIYLAILDPEPTSKLALLIAGGICTTVFGGFMILTAFRKGYNFKLSFGRHGFGWEFFPA